ncbi:MAG: DNRLRE domain-containing protein [Planctomycetota bacterium]
MTLDAAAEATILSTPSLAIGAGRVFAGNNFQNEVRRGLVRFDLSSLPAGDIVSARLEALVLSQRGFNLSFDIHRITTDWNEGPTVGLGSAGGQGGSATPTDATWTQTGLGGAWSSPGGDFEAMPTASATIFAAGFTIEFDVTADVQRFVDGSADNFGWIVISQTEPVTGNVIAMSTDDDGFQPITLTVEIVEACPADTNGDGELSPADFNAWIQAFNAQADACDQNGDGRCDPSDFNAWIANFNAGC